MKKRAKPDHSFDYICSECAQAKGGKWPEGHCATAHEGQCDICDNIKVLTARNDWHWHWAKQTLVNWD